MKHNNINLLYNIYIMSFENALFVLRAREADTTGTNNNVMTFRNISLRTLLGDMYDKYDRFKLVLLSIECTTTTTTATPQFTIEGLPFEGCTYNMRGKRNEAEVNMSNFSQTNNTTKYIVPYNDVNGFVFNKNQHLVTLIVRKKSFPDDNTLSTANYQQNLLFAVVGINDKPKIPKPLKYNMMANLTLRTNYATTINATKDNFTWSGLDFRKILGDDLFYGYKRFKLIINTHGFSGPPVSATGFLACELIMSANVNFHNCNYSISNKRNTNQVCLAQVKTHSATTGNWTRVFNTEFGVVFSLTDSLVNLNFYYAPISGASNVVTFTDSIFFLSIVGVDGYEN